jgi:mono/diheme cytochrome c family protein
MGTMASTASPATRSTDWSATDSVWRRAAIFAGAAAVVAAAAGWLLTSPQPLQAAALPQHQPDPANGELIFYAGGCASCHAAPEARGKDKLRLGGGLELVTDFGTFRVPNISPDPQTGDRRLVGA